jgi:hypothetical protein
MRIGLNWLGMGTVLGCCERGDEQSDSIKGGLLLCFPRHTITTWWDWKLSCGIILLRNVICTLSCFQKIRWITPLCKSLSTYIADFSSVHWRKPNSLGSSSCKLYRFRWRRGEPSAGNIVCLLYEAWVPVDSCWYVFICPAVRANSETAWSYAAQKMEDNLRSYSQRNILLIIII